MSINYAKLAEQEFAKEQFYASQGLVRWAKQAKEKATKYAALSGGSVFVGLCADGMAMIYNAPEC